MMVERLRVTTNDGKYTVIQEEKGGMRFLRHGEPWPVADRELSHTGLILALVMDLADARERAIKENSALKSVFGNVVRSGRPTSRLSPGDVPEGFLD